MASSLSRMARRGRPVDASAPSPQRLGKPLAHGSTAYPAPGRSQALAGAVEAPSVHSVSDVERLPVGSTATVGPDGGVRAVVKVGNNAWSGHGGAVTDVEVFELGLRRLALGPIAARSTSDGGCR